MKKIVKIVLVMGILFAFFIPQFALSRTPAEKQFEFAQSLYEDGKFELAIQEFQKFIDTFSDDRNCDRAQYGIGMSFWQQRDYGKAAQAFQTLIQVYPNAL